MDLNWSQPCPGAVAKRGSATVMRPYFFTFFPFNKMLPGRYGLWYLHIISLEHGSLDLSVLKFTAHYSCCLLAGGTTADWWEMLWPLAPAEENATAPPCCLRRESRAHRETQCRPFFVGGDSISPLFMFLSRAGHREKRKVGPSGQMERQ